jgi:hypothetical protein
MIARRGTTKRVARSPLGLVGVAFVLAGFGGCESGPSLQSMRTQGDRALEQRDYATAADWYEQYVDRRRSSPRCATDSARRIWA